MTVVVLLIGGDKRSQKRDITKAERYWLTYLEGEKRGYDKKKNL